MMVVSSYQEGEAWNGIRGGVGAAYKPGMIDGPALAAGVN